MLTTDTDTTTSTEAEPSDADREAMFREASKADAAPAIDEPEDPEPGEEPEPAPTPVAAPAPAAPAPAPAAEAKPPIVVEKGLDEMTPDELKAAVKAARNEKFAMEGRVAALQRAEEGRRKAAATPAPAAPPQVPEAERLTTAYPELAVAVKAELEESVSKVRTEAQQQIVQVKLDALSASFGEEWAETMQSDSFHLWLSKEPAEVRARYHSDSVADYASLLRGYQKAQAPSPPAQETADEVEARRIAAGRESRLQANAGVPRGRPTAVTTTGEPEDPDALFNHFARQDDAKRERTRRAR